MSDRELIDALLIHAQALDRSTKMAFIEHEATQKRMASRTPTSVVPGTFGFNGTNSATQLAEWRQLVPRNPRRKRITFMGLNQIIFFAIDDKTVDVMSLVNQLNNGANGAIGVAQQTLTAGAWLPIATTESIWALSIVGTPGSVPWTQYEQQATVSWFEEVYADISAIPYEKVVDPTRRPGTLLRLSPSDMRLDGDVTARVGRDGIR